MIIYVILPNGYFGGTQDVPDDTVGIPFGTTRTPIIDIPEGQYAIWTGAGWSLTVTPPPVEQAPEEEPVSQPEVIPKVSVVSMRQARRILFQYGYLSSVDEFIATLPSPEREIAQIDWEYATEVRKDSELVQRLASYLQLSPEQIDKLFYEASLII